MWAAVLFDLDNTLIDRDAAFAQVLAQSFPQARTRRALSRIDAGGGGSRRSLFAAWGRAGGGPIDQPLLARRIASQLLPDPALLKLLLRLRERCALGVVSNGGPQTQRLKLKAAGLGTVFGSNIWISGEVGVKKPDPRIFLTACQALGVPPGLCLYVGDREPIDGVGARAAGLSFRAVGGPGEVIALLSLLEVTP